MPSPLWNILLSLKTAFWCKLQDFTDSTIPILGDFVIDFTCNKEFLAALVWQNRDPIATSDFMRSKKIRIQNRSLEVQVFYIPLTPIQFNSSENLYLKKANKVSSRTQNQWKLMLWLGLARPQNIDRRVA